MLELGVGVCSRRWPDTRFVRHVLCSFLCLGRVLCGLKDQACFVLLFTPALW